MAEQGGNGGGSRRRLLKVEFYRAIELIARIEDDAQRKAAVARVEAIVEDALAVHAAQQLVEHGAAGVPEVRR